jgi:hypothetical protein
MMYLSFGGLLAYEKCLHIVANCVQKSRHCLIAHYLPFNEVQYDLYTSTYFILHVEAETYI